MNVTLTNISRLVPPARYTIGGGDIQNIFAIINDPNILFQWFTSGTSMAAALPQFNSRSNQPRGDVGTAGAYLLFVSNLLSENPSNDGNPAVNYDGTEQEWSSGGYSISADSLRQSWEVLLKGLYRYQHEKEVSIIEKRDTFKPETTILSQVTPMVPTKVQEFTMPFPVGQWKIFGSKCFNVSDQLLHIQNLDGAEIQEFPILYTGPYTFDTETGTIQQRSIDFTVFDKKIFVLYKNLKHGQKPVVASGVRRGPSVEEIKESSYRIKIIDQANGIILRDLPVSRPTEDEGNYGGRKLFLMGSKVVCVTSVDDYFEIDGRSLIVIQKKRLLAVPSTGLVNYVKDVATDKINLGILFHQGDGAVRHVLTSDGMIYPNVDNIGDWSSFLAMSGRYIVVDGLGYHGKAVGPDTNRRSLPRVLRVTDLSNGQKKTFQLPSDHFHFKSLTLLEDDAYVFGFLGGTSPSNMLYKINLVSGTAIAISFGLALDSQIQLGGPHDFWVSNNNTIQHYTDMVSTGASAV